MLGVVKRFSFFGTKSDGTSWGPCKVGWKLWPR